MAKHVLMNKDTEVMVVEQDDKTYQFIAVVELINTAFSIRNKKCDGLFSRKNIR